MNHPSEKWYTQKNEKADTQKVSAMWTGRSNSTDELFPLFTVCKTAKGWIEEAAFIAVV